MINSEAIQTLAKSISQISSIISELQKDKISANKDDGVGEDKQVEITERHEYSNVEEPFEKANPHNANQDDVTVDKGQNAIQKLNIQEFPKPISIVTKTNLEEATNMAQGAICKTSTQGQLPPHLHNDGLESNNSDKRFKGVERKRRKVKNFFLSGISEDVNEDQIRSCLQERKVTPTNISLFNSQRKGCVSEKVYIPVTELTLIEKQNFWPEFVGCRPWRKNARKYSTLV